MANQSPRSIRSASTRCKVKSDSKGCCASRVRSNLAATSSASTGVAGLRARLITRVAGLASLSFHRRQTSRISPMLVFSEKKIRSGSWDDTIVST